MRASGAGRVSARLAVGVVLFLVALAVPWNPYGLASDCSNTSVGLTPLTDLAGSTYQGEPGGLYPNGENTVPADHLALGLELSHLVVPRAADGNPSSDGSIVMISLGVSNTRAKFDAFSRLVEQEPSNPALVLVNAAQRGRALGIWASERATIPWQAVDRLLDKAGVTPHQVQVAWVLLPPGTRGPRTLAEARSQVAQLAQVIRTAKTRYPNLALAYLSSRAYGGYIADMDSEPNAYLHGYTVKWLVEAQIEGRTDLNADPTRGRVVAPWIAWGPYLWADGATPRSDGLVWLCEDFASDGVHPGLGVEQKVSSMMLDHFSTDPTTSPWFNGDRLTGAPAESPRPTPATNPTTNPTASTEPPDETESAATQIDPASDGLGEGVMSIKDQGSVWQLAGIGLAAGVVGGVMVGLWVIHRASDRRP
jgi:hypothetical protein